MSRSNDLSGAYQRATYWESMAREHEASALAMRDSPDRAAAAEVYEDWARTDSAQAESERREWMMIALYQAIIPLRANDRPIASRLHMESTPDMIDLAADELDHIGEEALGRTLREVAQWLLSRKV